MKGLGVPIVAILRPRDGTTGCLDTDVICTHHGATSAVRPTDCTLTAGEAADLAEGEGLNCDYCGLAIVQPTKAVAQ